MSCSNCKLFYDKCAAGCCGPVPINRQVFANNIELMQRPIIRTIDLGNEVLLETKDMTCTFLSPDFQCMIYDSRPDVCKKYGDESHILMTCMYQRADGSARSRTEQRSIARKQQEYMKGIR